MTSYAPHCRNQAHDGDFVHLPTLYLTKQQLTEKYGLKENQEREEVSREIEDYVEWNRRGVQLNRESKSMQTTTLGKHEDHIRGKVIALILV